MASKGHVDFSLLITLLFGISLVIASACVFNNYLDKDIDSMMSRTQGRALVTGSVSQKAALIYSLILEFLGFYLLIFFTNRLTVVCGLVGWTVYIFGYSFSKRRTKYSTLIGSIPGGMSIVAGYVSVTGRLDFGALILFAVMVCWQMPHFYSIGIRRISEYQKAKLPIWPVSAGIESTKTQMLLYIVGFIIATVTLGFSNYTGSTYIIAIALVGSYWLLLGIRGLKNSYNTAWAKKMFLYSLIVLFCFCFLISIDAWLV